jgi:threonine/homoserine/homoserine lactone efflux protein
MEVSMPELSTLTLFFVAAAVLLITPGPAVLYIVARSIDQGRVAGIVSTLGISFATFFHIAAAAWGVSALLLQSALAFNIIKYLGAAYLIYLGIRKFLVREEVDTKIVLEQQSLRRIFFQGAIVNLLNPKTALFFFAFLPQFVNPALGSVALQILFLGILFILMALVSDGMYALLAGTAGNWLRGNLQFLRAQRYVAGTIYIALGLTAAFTGNKNN